jgi:hypothetical protein
LIGAPATGGGWPMSVGIGGPTEDGVGTIGGGGAAEVGCATGMVGLLIGVQV